MPKAHSVFVCQNCGETYPKWQGQCASCGEWNTLEETMAPSSSKSKGIASARSSRQLSDQNLVLFSQVDLSKSQKQRFSTQIGEFDRVLGGGMVEGSVMLMGGEPGIGKSTLLTQMVVKLLVGLNEEVLKDSVAKKRKSADDTKSDQLEQISTKIMYVSGEESPYQISLRINRILANEHKNLKSNFGRDSGRIFGENLAFITSTDVDELCSIIESERPSLVIVDSIQAMSTEDLTGAAGSAGQLREATDRITTTVKRLGIPTFLVGHVTKEGSIAGPKVLEHIVDTVLELTGERTDDLRILRTLKNRFGPTDEVGVFRHNDFGLAEISNPSEIFLEHADLAVPGSATVCVMEGSRPLLLEVQALVIDSQLAMPRRVGRGIELSRIQVLSAVLQKHCSLPLGTSDVFLSAAGGFKVTEPSIDLGLAVAIASSLKNKPVKDKTLFIGEIGLLGEIRQVSHMERRIKEAQRLGFEHIISRKSHGRVKDVLRELGLT